MKKQLFYAALTLFVTSLYIARAQAQKRFEFGAKGGLNIANTIDSDFNTELRAESDWISARLM